MDEKQVYYGFCLQGFCSLIIKFKVGSGGVLGIEENEVKFTGHLSLLIFCEGKGLHIEIEVIYKCRTLPVTVL